MSNKGKDWLPWHHMLVIWGASCSLGCAYTDWLDYDLQGASDAFFSFGVAFLFLLVFVGLYGPPGGSKDG